MNTMMRIKCDWCGKEFEKTASEIKRRLGQGKKFFFCSRNHAAIWTNEVRGLKKIEIEKVCLFCGNVFKTMTGKGSATFCSRGCASAGSVTDYRRERAQEIGRMNAIDSFAIKKIAEGLRSRELWKYKKVEEFLQFAGIAFEFEHSIGNSIFDLALTEQKVLVDFDGPYHAGEKQIKIDQKKDAMAEIEGWKVVRVSVPQNSIIEPDVLYSVLSQKTEFTAT